MIQYFKKFIDWFNKFFVRAKGFIFIIIFIILVISLARNGFQRKDIIKTAEQITGLHINNDILLNENKQLDNALSIKDSLLVIKDFKIDSVSREEKEDERRTAYWRGEHGKISEILIEITSDSSYNFTQGVYNYPGDKKYGYNGPQVKAIHRTYLENENKEEQIEALTTSLFDCKSKTELINSSMKLLKSKYEAKSEQEENLEKVLDNKDEEIELTKKQIKRNSAWKKIKGFTKDYVIPVATFLGGIAIGTR